MKSNVGSKLFFLVLILIFTATTYGQKNYQPGYIINLSGDTIHGLINYRNRDNNPRKISFKKSANNETESITSIEIKEFGVANEIYKSGIVKVDASINDLAYLTYSEEYQYRVDTVFLQVLVPGEKSLYRYKDFKGKEHFFIGQGKDFELLLFKEYYKNTNGIKIIATNNKFVRQLCYYLGDCPEISALTANIKYMESSLCYLFIQYYSCINKEVKVLHNEKKSFFEFGVLAGLSVTKITFEGEKHDDIADANYSPSKSFSSGFFFDLIFPAKLKNRWSISNELLYTSFDTGDKYTKESQIESGYQTFDISLGYSYIKLNNMLRYKCFIGQDVSFYLNLGVSNGFSIKQTNYMKKTQVLQTPFLSFVEEGEALEDKKYEIGYIAGIGSCFKRISFEIRYEGSEGISGFVNLKSPTKRVYFLLGYRF